MGIFSRFFKGGQDGDPADPAGDRADAAAAENGSDAAQSATPPAATADDPAPGVGVTFRAPGIASPQGLTPALIRSCCVPLNPTNAGGLML